VLVVAGLALTFRAWSSIGGVPGHSLFQVLMGWFIAVADYQRTLLQAASGIVQYLFDLAPKWMRWPMVIAYGVAQPFLPAALTDDALPLWRGIAVLRGLGWYALLPFLGYGILAPIGQPRWRHLSTYLALVSVIVILVASYMAAGDQWDNPRYRASFIALQAALAGWGWTHARRTGSPWLKRLAVLLAGFVLIFLQWYVGRYYGTPSLDLLATLGLEGVFVLGYLLVSLALDMRRRRLRAGAPPG
jgi:hypothetical protein